LTWRGFDAARRVVVFNSLLLHFEKLVDEVFLPGRVGDSNDLTPLLGMEVDFVKDGGFFTWVERERDLFTSKRLHQNLGVGKGGVFLKKLRTPFLFSRCYV